MKRLFFNHVRRGCHLFAAVVSMGILCSCSSKDESVNSSDKVQVLVPMMDKSEGSSGSYSLQLIELLGISNLQEVKGDFAHFVFSPRIKNNHIDGEAPKARFIKSSSGAYIPANEITQQMVAIYVHLQNLANFDKEVGASGINVGPQAVGIGVSIKDGSENNAFYDPKTDALYFVPYTWKGLPIAVNGGIIAHEHFHSLFSKMVFNGQKGKSSLHDRRSFMSIAGGVDEANEVDDKSRFEMLNRRGPPGTPEIPKFDSKIDKTKLENPDDSGKEDSQFYQDYHYLLLSGMNEGLADFWAWVYSGDPDFIAHSIPTEKATRTLSIKGESSRAILPDQSNLKRIVRTGESYESLDIKDYLKSNAYLIGTQFARAMKKFTDVTAQARGVSNLVARKQVAKLLIKTLPKINLELSKLALDAYYHPSIFLNSFIDSIPDLKEKECLFLSDVWNNSFLSEHRKSCKTQDAVWKMISE